MARHDSSTTDFSSLSPAEIDQLVEHGRRLRAQQAGVLFDALRRRLASCRGAAKTEVMTASRIASGGAAT